MSYVQLLTGLDIDDVKNPLQVYWELITLEAQSKWQHNHELQRLDWDSREQLDRLPALIGCESVQLQDFVCRCPRLDVDEQRAQYMSWKAQMRNAEATTIVGQQEPQTTLAALPSPGEQLDVFEPLCRNRLAKGLKLARGQRSQRDVTALSLYKLEQLTREANTSLALNLSLFATSSARKLNQIFECSQGDYLITKDDGRLKLPIVMVRAPLMNPPIVSQARFQASREGDDAQTGKWACERSKSDDSGIESDRLASRVEPYELVKRYFALRSSSQVQSIVSFSLQLFGELIAASSLFRLIKNGNKSMTSQEVKLHACVECKKLRLAIRFQWITRCLELAFGGKSREPTARDTAKTPRVMDVLPPLDFGAQEEREYCDLLALLMGQMLRQHLMVEALERWCSFVEKILQTDSVRLNGANLSVQVRLAEQQGTGVTLEASQPQLELEQTMGFVVEELAAVCKELPRLESLVQSLQCAPPMSGQNDRSLRYISVLEEGDDLLARTKDRLRRVIEAACPMGLHVNPGSAAPSSWIHRHYLMAIELVNKFRCSQLADLNNVVDGLNFPSLDCSETPTNDDRLIQLRSSSLQIRLLNALEKRLNCETEIYYDLGSVQLDFWPLKGSLLKCIQKERLLLVRCNLDDLLKLMDRLRLQFDEIELGIDLESAIEEHLNDLWQAKQNLQPQEQIILADELLADQEEFLDGSRAFNVGDQPEKVGEKLDGSKQEEDDPDERFVRALVGNNSQNSQQLLLLNAAKNSDSEVANLTDRRVAPLIECQLLLGRYEYFNKLLNDDLGPLVSDIELSFEGLVFLSEFVSSEQLEPVHSSLIAELSVRSQEFTEILTDSMRRLNEAWQRLTLSNQLRSKALNRLVVEFNCMMSLMSEKEVAHELEQQTTKQSEGPSSTLSVGQLDSIQKTSEWAQKLELRFEFLLKQNSLLSKERKLLAQCYLCGQEVEMQTVETLENEMSQSRAFVLDWWWPTVKFVASLWRLAEDYETQQVKWLNSDIKRIEFSQIERTFNEFQKRLKMLKHSICGLDNRYKHMMFKNLQELDLRFKDFSSKRLIIFKLLSSPHLSESHWTHLDRLLSEGQQLAEGTKVSAQSCTTLAQFLDLGVEHHLEQLNKINHQILTEQELRMFLEAETFNRRPDAIHKRNFEIDDRLASWDDAQFVVGAGRYLEIKLKENSLDLPSDCHLLAKKLVATHCMIRRYISLTYNIGLNFQLGEKKKSEQLPKLGSKLVLRSHHLFSNPNQMKPSIFVEFLGLFTKSWIRAGKKLSSKVAKLMKQAQCIDIHLLNIQELLDSVKVLHQSGLKSATLDTDEMLVELERETVKLELEREILATKETLALGRQREALVIRDDCIRQITERAIPAIRAAAKALDRLETKSLRTLRCIRPNPPEQVKLVLEAVCILRSCTIEPQDSSGSSSSTCLLVPERRFDALKGCIEEDYWPVACRMLNGTHSSRFVADLRRVNKHNIPPRVMRLIRCKYLGSNKFHLESIQRVSRECALLAKWLIAVDVFDRVINVVRPNYVIYRDSEEKLKELLSEVNSRRRQIDAIGKDLLQMEESFEMKIAHKMSLLEALNQCSEQLSRVDKSRLEFLAKQQGCQQELQSLRRKQAKLTNRCILGATKTVYIDCLRTEERQSAIRLISAQLLSKQH